MKNVFCCRKVEKKQEQLYILNRINTRYCVIFYVEKKFFKKIKKMLTIKKKYNIMLDCKVMYPKGGHINEKNLSAKEASQKERARLHEENVYC